MACNNSGLGGGLRAITGRPWGQVFRRSLCSFSPHLSCLRTDTRVLVGRGDNPAGGTGAVGPSFGLPQHQAWPQVAVSRLSVRDRLLILCLCLKTWARVHSLLEPPSCSCTVLKQTNKQIRNSPKEAENCQTPIY